LEPAGSDRAGNLLLLLIELENLLNTSDFSSIQNILSVLMWRIYHSTNCVEPCI
jgi:hypothetical protein